MASVGKSDIEGTRLLALSYVRAQSGLFVPFIAFYTGVVLIDGLYDSNDAGERVGRILRKEYFSRAGDHRCPNISEWSLLALLDFQ